jgi:hypothetical protein
MDKLELPELPAGYRWKVGTHITEHPKVILQRKFLCFWLVSDYALIYDGLYAQSIDVEIVKAAKSIMKSKGFRLCAEKYFGIYE